MPISLTSQPSETKSQKKSVILSQILVVDIINIPKPYYLLKADTSFLQQLGFSFFCSLNNSFMNSQEIGSIRVKYQQIFPSVIKQFGQLQPYPRGLQCLSNAFASKLLNLLNFNSLPIYLLTPMAPRTLLSPGTAPNLKSQTLKLHTLIQASCSSGFLIPLLLQHPS